MMQANTLAIRRGDGIAEFEQYLGRDDLGRQSLALPLSIRSGGSLCRSVGLAQLVFTWAQQSGSPTVRTYIQSPGPDTYPNFVGGLYGFAATYFSDRVTLLSDENNIRMDLMRSCRPRVTAMSEGDLGETAKGRKVEFILVHGAKNEFHPLLYQQTPTRADILDRQLHGQMVASPTAMTELLRRSVLQCGNAAQLKALASQLNHEDNPLGHLLHESFRNTAEHAYLKVDGKIPSKVFRSVTVAVNQVERDEFKPSTVLGSEHPLSDRYFEQLRKSRESLYRSKVIDVLEISVLDSGPGFAQTIASRSAAGSGSPDDASLVAACFTKHRTAKSGPTSGTGFRTHSQVHTPSERIHAYPNFDNGSIFRWWAGLLPSDGPI